MKKILIFLLLFVLLSCVSKDVKENLLKNDREYFLNKAISLHSQKKYFLLNQVCDIEIRTDPDNHDAAYYKAISLQKIVNNLAALNFFINHMIKHPDMPIKYKEKWLDLALSYTKEKRISYETYGLSFYNDPIRIDPKEVTESFCEPKILENISFYFFLNEDGKLYMINKAVKKIKKVNYYKTRSFVLMKDYIVFNDSINLVKYEFIKNKYSFVDTFDIDEIYFINSSSNTDSAIFKYVESDFHTIKMINFETLEIKNIPNNTISQSHEFDYIAIGDFENFGVFDINGNFIASYEGEFLGFSLDSQIFYYYTDKHLHVYDLFKREDQQLLYIPEYSINKGFKAFTNNKILFCFDDNMLEIVFSNNVFNLLLTKGELIHIFKSGYIYKNVNDNRIYFYSMYFNTKNLIYQDESTLDNIILPDNNSYLFLIKKEDHFIVNNLSNFFP